MTVEITNERCYPEADETEGNPAWEFLKAACALFAPSRLDGVASVKCPYCNAEIPQSGLWQKTYVITDSIGKPLEKPAEGISVVYTRGDPASDSSSQDAALVGSGRLSLPPMDHLRGERWLSIRFYWMKCPNEACREIIVQTHRYVTFRNELLSQAVPDMWWAVPQKQSPRPIDSLVKDPFRRDYLEASAILGDSPRMSAVLARKILADLLEKYGKVTRSLKLSIMIDAFEKQGGHPSHVTSNLDYLREIADFSAHTQKDELGNIVEVEPKEAEWTLEVVDTLFDYFIIRPEKDKARRTKFDKKIEQAGRKPIKK